MKNVTIWLRYKIYNLSAKRPKYIDMKNIYIYIYKSLLFNMIFFLDINICIKKKKKKKKECYIKLMRLCGPIFFTCVPTQRWDSLLFGENLIFFFSKNTWSRHLFYVFIIIFLKLFFKEKQNKKENHVWLFIWKRHVCKNQIWIRESSYLL